MPRQPWRVLTRTPIGKSDPFSDPDLLRNAIEATRDGISISDARKPDMPLIYVNPAFESMSGYSSEEVLQKNCRFLQGEDKDQEGVREIRAAIARQTGCQVTLRNYRKDGTLFYNELSLSPVCDDDGTVTHYVGIQKDVSKRVEREAMLARRDKELTRLTKHLNALATTDELTGTMNRRAFDGALDREWRRALRVGDELSLFMLDLDHFKAVNDNHGHAAGDECLRRIGKTLMLVFGRATDQVARYGGEEFVVLCARLNHEAARERGEQLLKAVRSLELPGGIPGLTVSVGLCSVKVQAQLSAQQLLQAADAALYAAKERGRDRLVVASLSSENGASLESDA